MAEFTEIVSDKDGVKKIKHFAKPGDKILPSGSPPASEKSSSKKEAIEAAKSALKKEGGDS